MNEAQPVRPTKKQRELLAFIEKFIGEHGYSPSYREIMSGLNYTSVATVALHVNNLIKRGHIKKREGSARSLEVANAAHVISTNTVRPSEEKWLVEKIDHFFTQAESLGETDLTQSVTDQLHVLVGALKVLGIEGGAQSFTARLAALRKRVVSQGPA
jgi:SOS-response transcriptional repressor LexA